MSPAATSGLTLSLQIFPGEAPETEEQERATPPKPFPNS